MINIAKKYKEYGLSIIPVQKSKAPSINAWAQLQKEIASDEDINRWFADKNNYIGIIAGKVSGNLEIMDFDNHEGDAKAIFNEWKEVVSNSIPGLFEKLVVETSVSGGYHVFFRCETIGKNAKLARRHINDKKIDTFIETRGEGGYVVAAPSDGYKLIQNDFSKINIITSEERGCLFAAAFAMNEVDVANDVTNTLDNANFSDGTRPGDDYNQSSDFKRLLQSRGWTITQKYNNKEIWTRPGKKHGLSATWNYIPNKFYVFSTNAAPFEDQKTYSPFSIYTLLYCGDLSQTSFKTATKLLAKEGYGKASERKPEMKLVKAKANAKVKAFPGLPECQTIENVELILHQSNISFPTDCVFYYETIDLKGSFKLGINKSKLISFFEHFGFAKYWVAPNTSIFVRNENNIITEQTPETMFDFLKDTILQFNLKITENCDKFLLWETILQQQTKLITPSYLETINTLDKEFINDTKDECFVPFRNAVVKICKNVDFPILIDYKDFDKCIWKDTIIKRDFTIVEEAAETNKSMFGKFLERVCSPVNKEYPEDRQARKVDKQRLKAIMSSIGYLIHTYKDPTVTKAIIYCEEQIAAYDEANGRTGKGLTFNAISKIRKHHLFNGKQVDFNDKFFFQSIQQDTQVVVFDDVRKKFDFEALFSVLTEGISVEKKGQKPIVIPFERSPKVLITTNSVISNDSGSHRARKFEIEFSDYFSADYTPADDLGGFMFERGWASDSKEWDMFYNFMLFCVKLYLELGLIEYQTVNLNERKLKAEVPEEFIDFAYDEIDKLKEGEIIYRDKLYEGFTSIYPIFAGNGKLPKTQTIITQWFNKILKYESIKTAEVDKKVDRKKIRGWQKVA